MRERGPSSPPIARKIESSSTVPSKTPSKPTTPRKLEHLKIIPQYKKINVSGYDFLALENVRNIDNPNEIKHNYRMKKEDGTTLEVTIIEYGLNNPDRAKDPIPLRMDYGCPCIDMDIPLAAHDCKKQRNLAMESIQKIGRGIMVQINSEAGAGMGHGSQEVWMQQQWMQNAMHAGEQRPTAREYYEKRGFENFDIRSHHEVAALISRRLEQTGYTDKETPLILLGSSPEKIDSLQNGHKIPIADTAFVIDAESTDRSKDYHDKGDVTESGVYLEVETPDGKTKLVSLADIFPRYKELIFNPRNRKQKQGAEIVNLRDSTRREKTVFAKNQMSLAA